MDLSRHPKPLRSLRLFLGGLIAVLGLSLASVTLPIGASALAHPSLETTTGAPDPEVRSRQPMATTDPRNVTPTTADDGDHVNDSSSGGQIVFYAVIVVVVAGGIVLTLRARRKR